MRRAIVLVVVAAVIAAFTGIRSSDAESGDVILLHGWNGNAADWANAKAAYESMGFTVHALSLPRQGWAEGDTVINADYVQQYMTDHGITSARLDSHSLGGWLALTIAFSRNDSRVSSVVVRDTKYTEGWGCVLVPDNCATSAIIAAVEAHASAANPLPVLNLSSLTTQLPGVDCTKTYTGLNHAQYQTSAMISAVASQWPGTNPCTTPTPTPTPTPSCSWWQWLWGLC